MAGAGKKPYWRAAGVVALGLVLGASGVAAQETRPPPLSKDCQAGNAMTANETALPNVARALAQKKAIKILTIGASASAGRGAMRGGYTALIEEILQNAMKGLDFAIVNRGYSGEMAADAAVRIKLEVALNEPHLVLWQVGTNDALAYVPVDKLKTTVVETLRWLKAHNTDVVLVGLQFVDRMARDEHYQAVRTMLRAAAAEENVVIVRRYEAMQVIAAAQAGGAWTPDEFERTEAGYTCLAEYIARAITVSVFGGELRKWQQQP
jgi:hypothetical protein